MIYSVLFPYWYRLFSICWMVLLQTACSPQRSSATLPQEVRLTFGRGGGISGEVQSYILLDDGQLYTVSSLFTDTTHLASLELSKTQQLFDQADSLQLVNVDFQHPGNRYHFIRYQQHEITWGDPDVAPPPAIQQFYHSLQSIISKQK